MPHPGDSPARARRALVTGVGGQDGSLLARLLLDEGYEVAGVVRREPGAYVETLCDLISRIELVPKLVPIGKDQEMSWTVSVLTKKGRQLVIGYQVCLVGRA